MLSSISAIRFDNLTSVLSHILLSPAKEPSLRGGFVGLGTLPKGLRPSRFGRSLGWLGSLGYKSKDGDEAEDRVFAEREGGKANALR